MLPRSGPETRVVIWAAATFACLLAATFVIRPVRDAIVLDGDPELLPALWSATAIAMLVLAPAWGWVIGRVSRKKFVTAGYHVIAACLLAFIWIIHSDIDPLIGGRIFYVWAAVANMFVISVFWSLCADVLGPDTARRLYGPIAVGGTIGAIAGPLLAKALAPRVGVEGVLVAGAVLVESAVFCVYGLDRAARALGDTADAKTSTPVPGGMFDGILDLGRSSYLSAIGAYVLFAACAASFVYLETAGIVKAAFASREARTEFFASVDLLTNLGVLVIQALLTGPIIARAGVGLVLAILPVVQGAGLVAILAAPSLATVVAAQITSRAVQHALMRPSRELLFTVVPRDAKYRAKSVIDTLILRGGDVGSAWLRHAFVANGFGGVALLAVSLPMTAVWLATSIYLGAGFRRRRRRADPAETAETAETG